MPQELPGFAAPTGATLEELGTEEQPVPPGLSQIFVVSPELRKRLGKKYCDESEILPLLLNSGMLRRTRTIGVEVRPLGSPEFVIRLEVDKSRVGDAKVEIARVQGVPGRLQQVHLVTRREGTDTDEDRTVPENECLADGAVLKMRVKDEMIWENFDPEAVEVSERGMVATKTGNDCGWDLVISSEELVSGRHYWEVELVAGEPFVGICRPGLSWKGNYVTRDCTDGWFVNTGSGALFGNDKHADDAAGAYSQGDRVGVLLDLDDGSLCFFKNGDRHGVGYPAGSIAAGPVLRAL
jgi:hypothetical protein